MSMLPLVILLLLQANARGQIFEGVDEMGRPCALDGLAQPRVKIEDEWFRRAKIKNQTANHIIAKVRSEIDGAEAELDLQTRDGRGVSFTLILPSATGYVHACRLR